MGRLGREEGIRRSKLVGYETRMEGGGSSEEEGVADVDDVQSLCLCRSLCFCQSPCLYRDQETPFHDRARHRNRHRVRIRQGNLETERTGAAGEGCCGGLDPGSPVRLLGDVGREWVLC